MEAGVTGYRGGKLWLASICSFYVVVCMTGSLAPRSAAAREFDQVLYSFCSTGGEVCTDGAGPGAGLIMDSEGNLYGTTYYGGSGQYGGQGRGGVDAAAAVKRGVLRHGRHAQAPANQPQADSPSSGGGGTVFELIPNQNKTAWTYKVLYSFCSEPGCADGANPAAGLVMDKAGNLYGTTEGGGFNGGTVFELTPNSAKTAWTPKVLYRFCAEAQCADGGYPAAGLIMDSAENLYGTTPEGGASASGGGTVFELTPNSAKTAWAHKVLYSFCGQSDCRDGEDPYAGLILDKSGNLYGTTEGGGANGSGTVFKLTPNANELAPNANNTAWTENVLYSFCGQRDCTDGGSPYAGLIMDKSGNLYGTTYFGGGAADSGVVFELTPLDVKKPVTPSGVRPSVPNAPPPSWAEQVLYSFCAKADCADGSNPYSGLFFDELGKLYGTTEGGGSRSDGTAFELKLNFNKTKWTERVIYSFCARVGCTDGSDPAGSLIVDSSGNLYGTAYAGGTYSSGVVFKLRP